MGLVLMLILLCALFYACIFHNHCPAKTGWSVEPGSIDKYMRLGLYGFLLLMVVAGLLLGHEPAWLTRLFTRRGRRQKTEAPASFPAKSRRQRKKKKRRR